MDEIRQIPLAERICGAVSSAADIPAAMGMYTDDLMGVLGEMTGQEEKFRWLLGFVQDFEEDESPRRVCKLAVDALEWGPEERTQILFWMLAEPFALLYKAEGGEEC